MTISDLIRHNQCTAACVAATTSPNRCKCQCAGEFHGLVGGAHIDSLIDARRAGLNLLSDHEVLNTIERKTTWPYPLG